MRGPIVVGTDGSDTASIAVGESIQLAKAFDEILHVVCAYHPQALETRGLPSEFAGSVLPDSKVQAVLDDVLARARQAGVNAEPHAVTGDAADAILDLADQLHAGMIVVGNKGISSMRRYVLGNVPSKVVHHASCSTFVVQTT
jgi:nucleotide-binding universal stress UspA family protein